MNSQYDFNLYKQGADYNEEERKKKNKIPMSSEVKCKILLEYFGNG